MGYVWIGIVIFDSETFWAQLSMIFCAGSPHPAGDKRMKETHDGQRHREMVQR
ncbi:hypothetical protein [Falsirhodobacter algicola]|uniref:Uncharacterized protein n=1 Tax=Falsirhodobacter algicola TaxID=2692330 RepID=A0A8J8MRD7_9RHOB|nr:hypothetical protein [Falsirhodobacter algicola]QUS34971.1 hypothetical protein GR316_00990 [Falsirhodobacter algicola]